MTFFPKKALKRSLAFAACALIAALVCLTGCYFTGTALSAAPSFSSVPSYTAAANRTPEPEKTESPSFGVSASPTPSASSNTENTETTEADLTLLKYSGKPYAVVNGGIPSFSQTGTASWERYGELDRLGRCTAAEACIGRDIMPTLTRGPIGQIKPTGWQTAKYDFVDGKYLYNRCHLIGFQLTGENANERNLITGTRYLNTKGMLPFENMVADYIKDTGNHVMYRCTPVFAGNESVARGVHLEAYSVEDKGDGICFNVFIFNVQPGVKIDYLTGESSLENESTAPTPTQRPSSAPKPTPKPSPSSTAQAQSYVLNTKTHVFHYASCRHVSSIKDANRKNFTGSRDTLISRGYSPCGSCHP